MKAFASTTSGLLAALLMSSTVALAATGGMTAAQSAQAKAEQIGRGAKAWANNCGRCHNFRDPKEHSDKNWDVITAHMRTLAPLPGQDVRDIKAFLEAGN